MTKRMGSSICLGILLAVCSLRVADAEETRPLQTLVETVKGGAKAIGHETKASAEDILVLVRDDAAYLGTSVRQAPSEIGSAAKTAVPDLVDAAGGFLRSPDDGVESLADWLLEPLNVLAGGEIF